MSTITLNPVSGANSPCDGRINKGDSNSWATTRNASSGGSADVVSATDAFLQAEYIAISSVYAISRSVFNFDTSVLGAGAVITSAVLSFYSVTGGLSTEPTHPANLAIVSATPASTSTLATSDYASASFGSTRFSTDYSIATFVGNINQYHDITLNSLGRTYINKTGITSFGIRGSIDIDNVDPTTSGLRSVAICNMADAGSNKPKLVITYTVTSTLSATVANFALTGINVVLSKGKKMIVAVGSFILSGIGINFTRRGWTNDNAPTNTWTDENAPSNSWNNESK